MQPKATFFKRTSASIRAFNHEYVPEISSYVMKKFGPSYANPHSTTWRSEIQWNPDIAASILLHTRSFIRLQKSTDPNYLQSLTKLIADYLSKYFAHSPDFKCRNMARRYLEQELYDKSSYIKYLSSVSKKQYASR